MRSEIPIDQAGRIIIPKNIRDAWGLSAGSQLTLEQHEDGLLLRPAQQARMVQLDGIWVMEGAPINVDIVNLIEHSREERNHVG